MNSFEVYLQQKGMVQATIARHYREAQRYTDWLAANKHTTQSATKKELLGYLSHLKTSRHLSNATRGQVLAMLKNFYAYLSHTSGLNNIAHFVRIRGAQPQHLQPPLDSEERQLLTDAYYQHTQAYQPTAKQLRFYPDYDRLLQGRYIALCFMACQGLQVGEVLRLGSSCFDLRKGTINVCAHRRGAGRTLTLEAMQIGSLMLYFSNHPDGAILPNLNHFERLSADLKKVFPPFVDFTHLRSSCIVHWIKTYGLRKAQYMAGHRNISTTEHYLASDTESLQNSLDHFHPLEDNRISTAL